MKIGPNTSTVFWPGYGFMSRFGPKMADWEDAPPPDHGVDQYEINMMRFRMKRH